jgi:hypothetical protein
MGAEKLRRQPGRLDITAKEPKRVENPEQGRIIEKGRPDGQPCRTHGRKKARPLPGNKVPILQSVYLSRRMPAFAHSSATVKYRCTLSLPMT